jgi:hypothetical protein
MHYGDPAIVAGRRLHNNERIAKVSNALHYVPWMVANLTVGASTNEAALR